MTEIRIATRRSQLALIQARLVADLLRAAYPDITVSLVEIGTSGDVDRTSPVAGLTELGAFVRSVQHAVLDGHADLAVHSCKDLPVEGPDGLDVVYPERLAPWDVLCGSTLGALPAGATVGTGSPRRQSQLLALRPDLDVIEIRGNVDTRLRALSEGHFDAIVLAEAGLQRLGRAEAIDHRFSITEMVPAPGQAALAVEFLGDGTFASVAAALDDHRSRRAVSTERRLLEVTGAGCRSALGALATVEGDALRLVAFVDDDRGPRRTTVTGETPDAVVDVVRSELML